MSAPMIFRGPASPERCAEASRAVERGGDAKAAAHDTFGQRLARAREHACIKPDDLADVAGITIKRVHALETGGSSPPTPDQVNRMAGALKVSPLWLMAGELAGAKFVPGWYRHGGAA